jgi:hypothetical protein
MSKNTQQITSAIAEAKADVRKYVKSPAYEYYFNPYRSDYAPHKELHKAYKSTYLAEMRKALDEDDNLRDLLLVWVKNCIDICVDNLEMSRGKELLELKVTKDLMLAATKQLRKCYGYSERQWGELIPHLAKLSKNTMLTNLE